MKGSGPVRITARSGWVWCALAGLACTGQLGRESGSGATPSGGEGSLPGSTGGSAAVGAACQAPAPLRRLSNFEYENTLRDLFPGFDVGEAGKSIPGDVVDRSFVFDDRASSQGLSAQHVDAYGQVAERVARLVTSDATFTGCEPQAGSDACFESFLATFGERAFRRPLLPDEAARIRATFSKVKAGLGFQVAEQAAIERVLQSPQFLYRLELESQAVSSRARLSPHELATRLSYLIIGTLPDAPLLAAAKNGGLADSAGLLAQTERLLTEPGARANFQHLFDQLLDLKSVETINKDMQLYPRFTSEIARLMAEETRTFLGRVLFEGQGGFQQLLSADFTFVNRPLAEYYGLLPLPAGDAFEKVQLAAGRAAGLLSQGAFASLRASDKTSHPIKRGVFVRTRLLCDPLPPPPGNVPPAPVFTGHETARELMAKHSAAPECQGCHQLIDPLGLGLENLDAAGVWRDLDVNGAPVDASGQINHGGEIEGPFNGVAELGQRLAASEQVKACLATQYFRFGFGREPSATDGCTLDQLSSVFDEAADFPALVRRLVSSDAFQYRTD